MLGAILTLFGFVSSAKAAVERATFRHLAGNVNDLRIANGPNSGSAAERNGFHYPHAANNSSLAINEFAPFLFQNGGEFYKNNGVQSNLDSANALKAFKMWTGLFTNYKIQKQADFYNRFRSGEMPIGVADYSTYVLCRQLRLN